MYVRYITTDELNDIKEDGCVDGWMQIIASIKKVISRHRMCRESKLTIKR